jgi:transposase
MNDMAAKRTRPPEGSAAAVRAASAATEKPQKPTSRVYTPEYKQHVLRELERLRVVGDRGAIGAFLRREGLHAPTIARWEQGRDRAEKAALAPKKRGRKAKRDPFAEENERLRKQNEKLQTELRRAEIIIDVQKKLSLLLGVELPTDPEKKGTP